MHVLFEYNATPATTYMQALLKLDIEGSEIPSLHKAETFFETLDIPVIFMEWGITKQNNKDGKAQTWAINFFTKHGYAPFQHAFR